MIANYRIIKLKKQGESNLVQYTLERLEPGKIDSFRMTCPEIKGASVGQEVDGDFQVQISFVVPGVTIEDKGNIK